MNDCLNNVAWNNEFHENDEWDQVFDAVDDWDEDEEEKQKLIAESKKEEQKLIAESKEEQKLIAESKTLDDGTDTPPPEYLNILRRFFAHKAFRPMQWKIINSVINEGRDNCAVMSTGYGKSLCFQYPSVYKRGVTIVVSPLIALMQDQVLSLTMANIPACLLGSAQTEKRQVIEDIFNEKYHLVYLTPEYCCYPAGSDLLRRIDQNIGIILIAIDEAHCVSSWGHDFRREYRELGKLRTIVPNAPILAVTATATKQVRNDIIKCLGLRNPQVLISGFDRPNLQFFVYLKGSSGFMNDLMKVSSRGGVLEFPGSTIIYCITRRDTISVTTQLQKRGIKCVCYHAKLSPQSKKEAHEKFVKDKVKVVVATIAFGMGIDKPDVRNVIHYGAARDLESYYQEVGRAGRDAQPSNCITFYKDSDFDMHDKIRETNETGPVSNTNKERRKAMQKIMIKYLQSRDCRREFILNHFEGAGSVSDTLKNPKKCCDNCIRKFHQSTSDSSKYIGLDEKGLYDFTKDCRCFLAAVKAMGGRFGLGTYILLLRGSKSSKIGKFFNNSLHGSGKYQTEDWWKSIGRILEREGYLTKKTTRLSNKNTVNTFEISTKGTNFCDGDKKLLLQPPPEIFNLLKTKQSPESLSTEFSSQPSTSKKSELKLSQPSTSKKSSLKLLKPGKRSSSEYRFDSDNMSENSEADTEKEERMKVYKLLMNARAEIAASVDCMPYMVASNEALMKMAQLKPLTIKELRESRLDGFTEAKINRFGEEFVKNLRIICHMNPNTSQDDNVKRSIYDVLNEHPLAGFRIGATALSSYEMYNSGLTVQEIAARRGVIPETVLSHLISSIKAGYLIPMIDLNVTDEMRDTIISAIKKPPISSDLTSATAIKNACPENITLDAVKVVTAYVQVREHLNSLNIKYEDFESPSPLTEHQVTSSEQSYPKSTLKSFASSSSDSTEIFNRKNFTSKSKPSLSTLKKSEKREASRDYDDCVTLNYDSSTKQPNKKKKLSGSSSDLEFLDSPPRSTHVLSKTVPKSKITASQTSTTTDDLDKTVLDDDMFEELVLRKDNILNTDDSPKIKQLTLNLRQKDKFKFKPLKTCTGNIVELSDPKIEEQPAQISSSSQKEKKKFNFKSQIPLSVEKSTSEFFIKH